MTEPVQPDPEGFEVTTIEVFADIWCPFAHVGLRAIEEQRARAGRTDVAIRVRAWPLELVNGAPLDPTVTGEHAEELRDQVAPTLFQGLDLDHFPTSTLEALALANRAYRSDLQLGERVSFALRDALFEEGRDISDRAVLDDLAHDLGVPDARRGRPRRRARRLARRSAPRSTRLTALLLRRRRRVLPDAGHHQGSGRRTVRRPGHRPADGLPGSVLRAVRP